MDQIIYARMTCLNSAILIKKQKKQQHKNKHGYSLPLCSRAVSERQKCRLPCPEWSVSLQYLLWLHVLPVVLPVSVKRVVPHMNMLTPKHISVRNLQNSDQTAHLINEFHMGRSFEYL